MRWGCALVAAAALLLAGCAKDSGKATAAPTAIKLACTLSPDAGLVHLALAQGYLAAEGLAVSVKPFMVGRDALAALIKGEADIAIVLETPLVFAILGGEKVYIIASVATSDKNLALVANRDAGVAAPGDLLGKDIGLPKGTAAEYFVKSFLVAHKIPFARVRIVDTQAGDLLAALKDRRISAAVLWNPLLLQVDEALRGRGIVFSGENIYTANDIVVGDRAFIDKNPGAIKALVRALIRSEEFLKKSPDKAITAIAAYTKIDEGGLRSMLPLFRFKVGLDPSLQLVLEDESRWARTQWPEKYKSMPNFLDYIYPDALLAVAPERLRLIR
jgi:ABC-type nitrate/sulfonate/bicarbonate transport system substrate-binding protein